MTPQELEPQTKGPDNTEIQGDEYHVSRHVSRQFVNRKDSSRRKLEMTKIVALSLPLCLELHAANFTPSLVWDGPPGNMAYL